MFEKFFIGKIKKYFKKKLEKYRKKGMVDVNIDLPKISVDDLKTGDILIFYGGNKLTEFHGRYRDPKLGTMENPPYHAAEFYEHSETDHIIIDPELQTSMSPIAEYTTHPHIRIEIIRYSLDQEQIDKLRAFMHQAAKEQRIYDWKGYGSFIQDFEKVPEWAKKLIGKLKPSNKDYFCSDFCASSYEGVRQVSDREPNKTSPLDLVLYAHRNNIKRYLLK